MADDTNRPADEARESEVDVDQGVATPSSNGADQATHDAETPKPKRKTRSRVKTIDLTSDSGDADEKPKRTSRKKKADDETEEKPKRSRSRKKKEEPEAEEAPTTEEADDAPEAEEKPKRRRRTRKAEPVASSDSLPEDSAEADEDADDDDPNEGSQNRRREDDDGGRGRRRRRKKKKGGSDGGGHPGQEFEGVLELIGDKKFGFIREFKTSLQKGDNDPFMPPPLIQKHNLRDGVKLTGIIKPGRKGAWQVTRVDSVMDGPLEEWEETEDFDRGMVIYPEEKLNLVKGPNDPTMRVIDLVSPLGKGQRALIVAPPRAGKTVILKKMAEGLAQNHPEVKLIALLIDERPEEVTDFRRNTEATVFASSNDYGEDNHVRVATLAFEYARRMVEQGHDVVMLLDSLTRLGRTFNLFGGNSGRTMSGGLDARALVMPRKIFGAARNIEEGGSLTIIATALVETGSRMDDVIFEEFKGTGNAEIVLDRELSEKRIYPAINIRKSGTRNEERLVPEEHVAQRHLLLRALNSRHPVEAMQALLKQIQMSPTNVHLLNELIPEQSY
ncbi:MAG: transcription termination factor Rho [Bacteroidota bacterium]